MRTLKIPGGQAAGLCLQWERPANVVYSSGTYGYHNRIYMSEVMSKVIGMNEP